MQKTCSKCNQVFDLTNSYFYRNKSEKDGFRSECMACTKKYVSKNVKRLNEKQREYYKNNKDKIKKYLKSNRNSIRAKKKIYSMTPEGKIAMYRGSAKKRNLFWRLSLEEFTLFWQKPCIYCGNNIETIGLDRIDNAQGYIIDNVISCCYWCNIMKHNYPMEDFILQCKKIVKNFNSL